MARFLIAAAASRLPLVATDAPDAMSAPPAATGWGTSVETCFPANKVPLEEEGAVVGGTEPCGARGMAVTDGRTDAAGKGGTDLSRELCCFPFERGAKEGGAVWLGLPLERSVPPFCNYIENNVLVKAPLA
jgi:hypothetical protein